MSMIIDIHAHCSPGPSWLSYDPVKNQYIRWITVSELVKRMGEEGIDVAIVLPLPSPESTIEPVTTREVIEFCKKHRGRRIPF
ncbi:MAG: hypothetical protein ACPL4E_01165 [Thermoproteota archaeon]